MEKKRIALTFDDGPSNVTNSILDILGTNSIPETFFLIGYNIVTNIGNTALSIKLGRNVIE